MIKISELTPKGANLQNSDLLEISQVTADGYDSKSITGAEIITAAQSGMQVGLVSGTNIKTINSTSLLGSGNVAVQPTLVSGTNIKTINGNSLLGSGDLVVGGGGLTIGTTAITSGTVGRVLFEGTGNVLQESANLFWNNTNSRLGIGTASPSYTLQIAGTFKATGGTQAGAIYGSGTELTLASDAYIQCTSTTGKNAGLTIHRFSTSEFASIDLIHGGSFATGWSIQSKPSSTRLEIVDRNPSDNTRMCFHNGGNIGIGTTTDAGFKLDVNGTARVSGNLTLNGGSLLMNNNNIYVVRGTGSATDGMEIRALSSGTDAVKVTTSSVSISSAGGLTYQASAQLAVDSTTRGFLPPRMTTTQKNAIASPASGLIVYDTTDNKHYGYNGTAWTAFY